MQNRSHSFDRSPPEGDDGDSTPLGHRSRSPFLTGPGDSPIELPHFIPRFYSKLDPVNPSQLCCYV